MYKMYKKVIVGIDDDDHAESILGAAIKIAKEVKSKIIIASSIPFMLDSAYGYNSIEGGLMSSYIGPTAEQIDDQVHNRKQLIEALVAKIVCDDEVEVEIIVSLEDAKDLILGIAAKYEQSLIVLGATSKKSIERFFVGSVAQYIVNNAPTDVYLIKA
ncbi:universal stress protein UspA [Erysipelotrichaceae bacterium]|nr:universal stress protein UspA [Erysipelotrichaceae bacterium]